MEVQVKQETKSFENQEKSYGKMDLGFFNNLNNSKYLKTSLLKNKG